MDRRTFFVAVALASFAPGVVHAQTRAPAGPPASAQSPEQIVRWIYAEAVKKDSSGGQNGGTIFGGDKGPIRRLFSAAFLREWDAAQARIKKSGDMGLDFDPVSNSQDPAIGRVTYAVESTGADKSTVGATFGSLHDPKAKPQTIRYDFVREGGAWKIDNIRGNVENDSWSMRELMKEWK